MATETENLYHQIMEADRKEALGKIALCRTAKSNKCFIAQIDPHTGKALMLTHAYSRFSWLSKCAMNDLGIDARSLPIVQVREEEVYL